MHKEHLSQLEAQGLLSHRDMIVNVVAVNDNSEDSATWDTITTVCPYCSTDALRPAREDGCRVCYTDNCNCHVCGECDAELSDPIHEDGEISTAFDPCVKCATVAPLDIHGVCIACELPEQFGKGI